MSCPDGIRKEVLALALGELPAGRALETERHLAGCRECAALRLAVLGERAALGGGAMPLLAAGPAFSGAAARAAAAGERGGGLAAAGLVMAAGLAVLLLLGLPQRRPAGAAAPRSLTAEYSNPYSASVPGGVSATDFLYSLSARSASAPAAGPVPLNLKEGL